MAGMEPRVFYPGGPRDVMAGFLTAACGIACIGGLIWGIFQSHVFSLIYWTVKLIGLKLGALLIVGVSAMLYREQVFVDPLNESITLRRFWFVFQVEKMEFAYSEVRDVSWIQDGEDNKMILNLTTRNITLLRSKDASFAELESVRKLLHLADASEQAPGC